ncbi:MAG: YkgJ family cysteine cluster protein [Candidatus Altiarchaeota archaeon]|nr:YkgJ family cysteine cluster protein [Candidatus Altiarchaeota archaeon]
MLDGWVRRRVLWYLRRGYVKKMSEKKIGKCTRCGTCCMGCPAYDKQGEKCRIYRLRPNICKAFPLTPDDNIKIKSCGFSFKE